MIFVCGLVFTVSSCHQDDDTIVSVEQTQVTSSNEAAKAPLAWNYVNDEWDSYGGLPWNKCYNAYGTNQTSKKAVVTVNNAISSSGSVNVTIKTSKNACIFSSGTTVATFTVNAGYNGTRVIDIAGRPADETQIYVRIQPSTSSGSYSGVVTYGYEY